jgi:hypothetical protein
MKYIAHTADFAIEFAGHFKHRIVEEFMQVRGEICPVGISQIFRLDRQKMLNLEEHERTIMLADLSIGLVLLGIVVVDGDWHIFVSFLDLVVVVSVRVNQGRIMQLSIAKLQIVLPQELSASVQHESHRILIAVLTDGLIDHLYRPFGSIVLQINVPFPVDGVEVQVTTQEFILLGVAVDQDCEEVGVVLGEEGV